MLPGSIRKLLRSKSSSRVSQYEYSRPDLLGSLSSHAVEAISSSVQRIVVCPTRPDSLPWASGYAEVVNAGKSRTSEDQAVCREVELGNGVSYTLFGLFDGHGGNGASMKVAMELPLIIHQNLLELLPMIVDAWESAKQSKDKDNTSVLSLDFLEAMQQPFEPTLEELIRGALESSLWVMDSVICNDRKDFNITGGTTCLVSLFICDRIFVANAGDSRSVLFRASKDFSPEPLSFDFTPESDRRRLQEVAFHKPDLLSDPRTGDKIFSRLQFSRALTEEDVGKFVLYRDYFMSGWALKEVTQEDVDLLPLISGRGKGVRLMLTMGVARSLGDFDLMHRASLVNMKEFLTAQPEVQVFPAYKERLGKEDVLVMATDGMWDVLTNEEVAREMRKAAELSDKLDPIPEITHTQMAKHLVELARGEKKEGFWEKGDGSLASGDDISVFVIPLVNFPISSKDQKSD